MKARYRLGLCLLALVRAAWAGDAAPLHLYTLDYPPYEYQEQGEAKGMAVDLVREAFRRLHRDVTVEVVPWPRALMMAKSGKVDGLFTVFRTAERQRYLDYCQEVLIEQTVVPFLRAGAASSPAGGIAGWSGLRVGLVNQISYGPYLDQMIHSGAFAKVEWSNNFAEALRKFGLARFDVLLASADVGRYYLRQQGIPGLARQLPQAIERVPSYLAWAATRHLKEWCEPFDRTLAQMKKDGAYQAIVDRYNLPPEPAQ
jgi:polar amino acid transport system substrate-binding protein